MHLTDDELRRLEALVVEQGLVDHDWLQALFSTLPAAVSARLPYASAPADRLEQCMARLNEMGSVTGAVAVIPLEEVLEQLTKEPLASVSTEARLLLEHLKPRFDELRRHPGPIQVARPGASGPSAAAGPPTLTLSLTWTDIERQLWRVEPGGARCPAVATVQMNGTDKPPTVEWRARKVFSRGTWQAAEALTPAESGKDGVSMWRAPIAVSAATLRSSLLEVRAREGEQRARASRLVVPVWGLRVAVGMLIALLVFSLVWLYPLPDLAIKGGLAVVALAAGIAVLRGRLADPPVRGPLSGVATFERAGGVALFVAAAVVILPPLLLVIVENQTKVAVKIRKINKSVLSVSPGEGRTLMTWDSDLSAAEDAEHICVCIDDATKDGCVCEIDSVRWVNVYNVRCKRAEWKDLGGFAAKATLSGAKKGLDGVVWLETTDACLALEPGKVSASFALTDAGLPGDGRVTVHPPWRSDLTPILLDANLRSDRLAISGGDPRSTWLTIEGLATSAPVALPAIDPAWRALAVEVDEGQLTCKQQTGSFGTDAVELTRVDAPPSTILEAKGALASTWKPATTRSNEPTVAARVCSRERVRLTELEMTVPALEPGARFRMPRPTHVVIRTERSDAALEANGCTRPMAAIAVAAEFQQGELALARGQRADSLAPDGRPAERWRIDPVVIGDRKLALVCDPPARPVKVTLGRVAWVLGPRELRLWSEATPPTDEGPTPMPLVPTPPPTDPATPPPDAGTPPTDPVRPTGPLTRLPTGPDIRVRPTICMASRTKPESVTMRMGCPITHPDDTTVKCQTITGREADLITRRQAAAGRRCSSVCLCLD